MPPLGRSALFVSLLLVAWSAPASVATGALTGRVRIGTRLSAGVTVTASSTALQKPRTTVTARRGRYWLAALPPGMYDVTFSLPGHTSVTKRAVIELAKVARTDASLEPSEDEESITSTATTPGIADTVTITSHFDDRSLDRLPTGRIDTASIAPGGPFGNVASVDGITFSGSLPSEETIQQSTVIRGAAPVEWETFAGSATAVLTRSGGEDFFFTLRDTLSSTRWNDSNFSGPDQDDGTNHFGEVTTGGRIVPERLWFFVAGWTGRKAYPWPEESEGILARLDAQIGTSHRLNVRYQDAESSFGIPPYESDTASVLYTAAPGPRFTSEILASRTTSRAGGFDGSADFASGRASYDIGGHIATAGFSALDDRDGAVVRSYFAGDRWSSTRWNIEAGVRYDDTRFEDRFTPRVAVTWDVRANGRSAIAASYGQYASNAVSANTLRIATLGYATAIGRGGSARVDLFHRSEGSFWIHEAQLDARYRLFDRLEAGGTYTLRNQYLTGDQHPTYPEQDANVWFGVEVPVGGHEVGVTVLQHYREFLDLSLLPTDLALRYAFPLPHLRVLLAIDATNVFREGDRGFVSPRAVRGWVRLTL